MMDLNLEIIVHGVPGALQGLQMEDKLFGAVAGGAIGTGSVFMADGIMDQLMHNNKDDKTPLQAAAIGSIEEVTSGLAMSLLLDNPITMSTVGMSLLFGAAEGTVIHSIQGEVDWNTNWLSWN